jgi:hypothetical protein
MIPALDAGSERQSATIELPIPAQTEVPPADRPQQPHVRPHELETYVCSHRAPGDIGIANPVSMAAAMPGIKRLHHGQTRKFVRNEPNLAHSLLQITNVYLSSLIGAAPLSRLFWRPFCSDCGGFRRHRSRPQVLSEAMSKPHVAPHGQSDAQRFVENLRLHGSTDSRGRNEAQRPTLATSGSGASLHYHSGHESVSRLAPNIPGR